MSDIKKYLDYEGVKHLWSKINMQDYPNNETLIAVINAIDESKADNDTLNTEIKRAQAAEVALDARLDILEDVSFVEISASEVDALFKVEEDKEA